MSQSLVSSLSANTTSILVSLALVAIVTTIYDLTHKSPLANLPGPPAPSLLAGNVVDMRTAKVGTRYNVWAKQYGRTYKVYGPFKEPWLMVGDPKGISHVLTSKSYVRPAMQRTALLLWFGKGLFTAEGDEHRKMRRMLNPAFTYQSIQEISHIMFTLADRLKTQWEDKIGEQDSAVFDVSATIHMLSLDAISMTMFMHNLSATEGHIPDLLHKLTNGPQVSVSGVIAGKIISTFPILLRLPVPHRTWADMLRTELGSIADEVWSGARKDEQMDAKMLNLLNKQADEESISKEEAIAQIIGLLFAGSETVANVMSELFYELSRQPRIQDKLRYELDTFVQSAGREPTYEDIMGASSLPYLEAVTRETMRCKAVLMYINRTAVEDDVIPLQHPIQGTDATQIPIKAGQTVYIPVRDGLHLDEEIWGPDAAEFRPERWLEEMPEAVQSIRAQGHVLTFGDGPKICLGRNFALAEFKIVASVMVRNFAFEDDGSVIDFYHLGSNTVKPKVRGREEEGVQMPLRVRKL